MHGIPRGCVVAALVALAACQTAPTGDGGPVTAESSMLVVDVRFPVTLGRDPSLVKVFLVRGPIHGGLPQMPELIRATLVKDSRAYLLDPPPGTYSLVAVNHAYSPPRNRTPVKGVRNTISGSGDIGNLVLLSSKLIEQTRIAVVPGRVAFMGALEIHEGQRINADTRFQDVLQERLAEAVRPGVTSADGIAGRFTRAWTLDEDASSLRAEESDWQAFLWDAAIDLDGSAWAGFVPAPVVPRIAAEPEPEIASEAPALVPDAPVASPVVESVTPSPPPDPVVALPPSPPPDPVVALPPSPPPDPVVALPPLPPPDPVVALPPSPPPSRPSAFSADAPLPAPREPPRPPPVPRGTGTLDQVEAGMSHDDVRHLLGDPDGRSTYMTMRALIPFYSGADTHHRTWTYDGEGKVVFSLNTRTGALRVIRVVRAGDEVE